MSGLIRPERTTTAMTATVTDAWEAARLWRLPTCALLAAPTLSPYAVR